jgi:hypothetical protein
VGIPVESSENSLSLREFIAGLRAELKAAHHDAEQSETADGPRFAVGPVNVEFTMTAKKEAGAKGGVRFYVFELGASGSVASESIQRVSLALTPETKEGGRYRVSGPTSDDPR